MRTFNATVGLALVLYGNTIFLLSNPLGFSLPGGSVFGWFMVIEGLASIIAGFVVTTMGLTKPTTP